MPPLYPVAVLKPQMHLNRGCSLETRSNLVKAAGVNGFVSSTFTFKASPQFRNGWKFNKGKPLTQTRQKAKKHMLPQKWSCMPAPSTLICECCSWLLVSKQKTFRIWLAASKKKFTLQKMQFVTCTCMMSLSLHTWEVDMLQTILSVRREMIWQFNFLGFCCQNKLSLAVTMHHLLWSVCHRDPASAVCTEAL